MDSQFFDALWLGWGISSFVQVVASMFEIALEGLDVRAIACLPSPSLKGLRMKRKVFLIRWYPGAGGRTHLYLQTCVESGERRHIYTRRLDRYEYFACLRHAKGSLSRFTRTTVSDNAFPHLSGPSLFLCDRSKWEPFMGCRVLLFDYDIALIGCLIFTIIVPSA